MLEPQYQEEQVIELPADGAPISYEQLELLMRHNMLTPEQQQML